MRLIITLKPEAEQNLLGTDIQFFLPKIIRFLLSKTEEGNKLREKPLNQILNYNLKFSPMPKEYNNTLILGQNNIGTLTISSYSKDVIDILNQGLLKINHLLIQNHAFSIDDVSLNEDTISESNVKIRPMVPILSGKFDEDRKYPFYFKWNHPEFLTSLSSLVKQEYEAVYGDLTEEETLTIQYDKNYLKFNKDISKIVTIHRQRQKAVWAPFYLSGDPKLIQFALDMGLGLNKEIGYGMIELSVPKERKKEKNSSKPKINLDELPDNFGNLIEYQTGY